MRFVWTRVGVDGRFASCLFKDGVWIRFGLKNGTLTEAYEKEDPSSCQCMVVGADILGHALEPLLQIDQVPSSRSLLRVGSCAYAAADRCL